MKLSENNKPMKVVFLTKFHDISSKIVDFFNSQNGHWPFFGPLYVMCYLFSNTHYVVFHILHSQSRGCPYVNASK